MERNTSGFAVALCHYGTVKWQPRVDGRWNCCSEMFSLDYWWIVSQCNTRGYVWKYILYSYMKGFGQVRFNFDDIWQRVNFDAQRVSEQTGKLSGGPRSSTFWSTRYFGLGPNVNNTSWIYILTHEYSGCQIRNFSWEYYGFPSHQALGVRQHYMGVPLSVLPKVFWAPVLRISGSWNLPIRMEGSLVRNFSNYYQCHITNANQPSYGGCNICGSRMKSASLPTTGCPTGLNQVKGVLWGFAWHRLTNMQLNWPS